MKKLISAVKRKAQRGESDEQPALQIGRPSDLILQIPRPRLDPNGVPVQATDHDIDRDTMRAALANMARYLHSNGQNLTVIAVGGAVNLLLLQSRQSTHDLDFMGIHLSNAQRVALDEAAQYAEAQSSKALGAEWFNNQTQMWLSPPLHRQLTEQALQQNEIVFQDGGLTVLAAPWMYAVAAKTHRISKARRGEQPASMRPYDAADAAAYLHIYIERHAGRLPSKATLRAVCQAYGLGVDAADIQTVNSEYRRLYGSDGILD